MLRARRRDRRFARAVADAIRAAASCRRRLAMARTRAQQRRRAAARGGARLRRRLPPHHVARRLRVPRGRPFDAQLRPDVRRRRGRRRAAPASNATRCATLLSYTAQQASGVSCWMRDEEHIEKAFDFGGMPARNGVTAATMVAHGFTGVEDVFSGERNFFVAYGRAPQARGAGPRARQRPTRS